MNRDILHFIRNTDDSTMINIALDLALKNERLFIDIADQYGLRVENTYEFPHGRDTISGALLNEIDECTARGDKIAAIKAYRKEKTSSLREAKDAVEYLMDTGAVTVKPMYGLDVVYGLD